VQHEVARRRDVGEQDNAFNFREGFKDIEVLAIVSIRRIGERGEYLRDNQGKYFLDLD
jgi:hypothetical protein